MAITHAFHEAVAGGNIRGVRIMMKDSLLTDPTFAEFYAMEREARSMPRLYDVHDGREFQEDPSTWDDAYMDQLMVQIVGNFSKERLQHLMKVVSRLHPAPKIHSSTATVTKSQRTDQSGSARTFERERRQSSDAYTRQKEEDMQNGRVIRVVGCSAAGAVAGGTVAAIVGATTEVIVGAAVTGAAVCGIVAAIVTD